MIRIMSADGTEPFAPAAVPPWPAALLAAAQWRRVEPGGVLFRNGDAAHHVYGLAAGRVVLNRVGAAGEDIVIHVALAGECFAEASLHGGHFHCTAVAAEPATVAMVPADLLRERIQGDPAFALQWTALLARQLRTARARVERLCLRSAAERVRHLLQTEGSGPACAYTPRGPLKALAAELGLTPEALYRTLATMQRAGSLRRVGTTLCLA